MKLSQRRNIKRLLTAVLAATSLTWSGGTVYAEQDVNTESPSNNELDVRNNSYILNGNTVSVFDGYNFVYGGGNESNSQAAFGNRVLIYSGTFNGIFSGMSYNSVYNNRLIMYDGTVRSGLVGGTSIFYGLGYGGDVYGNTVEVNGGTVRNVSGGEISYGYLADGSIPNIANALGKAYNNSAIIRGGIVTGDVIGGVALSGDAYGNNVDITGGTISGNVVGGQTRTGNAYGNTINISGSPNLINATKAGESAPLPWQAATPLT